MSKKRQNLVEHAETLFYENGFHAIGLKRIVNEAGVALMTLYNHFDSKEALIQEVLNNREKRYFSFLDAAFAGNNNKDTTTYALLLAQSHIQWLRTDGTNGCMFLRAKEEYSFENEQIVNQAVAHKNALRSYFLSLGFTQKHAIQLAMLFEGATALAEVLDIDDVANELINMIETLFRE